MHQANLEACPTEEILLIGDPDKVYGEQWYFTYTAEAFETQLKLQKAGEEEDRARLEAEAEVREAFGRVIVYASSIAHPYMYMDWKSVRN